MLFFSDRSKEENYQHLGMAYNDVDLKTGLAITHNTTNARTVYDISW
jgi:hypothetical protein